MFAKWCNAFSNHTNWAVSKVISSNHFIKIVLFKLPWMFRYTHIHSKVDKWPLENTLALPASTRLSEWHCVVSFLSSDIRNKWKNNQKITENTFSRKLEKDISKDLWLVPSFTPTYLCVMRCGIWSSSSTAVMTLQPNKDPGVLDCKTECRICNESVWCFLR